MLHFPSALEAKVITLCSHNNFWKCVQYFMFGQNTQYLIIFWGFLMKSETEFWNTLA